MIFPGSPRPTALARLRARLVRLHDGNKSATSLGVEHHERMVRALRTASSQAHIDRAARPTSRP